VTGVWARTTPPGAQNGVVYLRLESARADRLVAATVAPDVAAGVELHASMGRGDSGGGMAGMPGMGGSGGGGTMTMRTLASVRLPAGRTVVFEPGGRHVMLVGLARTLTRGDRFPITLDFARSEALIVTVTVRDGPP
jgi:periplasmic copper chaperone A